MSWEEVSASLLGLSCSSLQFAFVLLVQSTALTGLGLAAGRLVRKKGAAIQSAVYRTTLVAVILCPAASLLLQLAGIEGLAGVLPKVVSQPEDTAQVPAPRQTETAPAVPLHRLGNDRPALPRQLVWSVDHDAATLPDDLPAPNRPVADAPPSAPVAPGAYEAAPSPAAVPTAETAPKPPPGRSPTKPVVCLLSAAWALGSLLLLLRLLAAHLGILRLRRSACDAERATVEQCGAVARRLGIRPPPVLRSPFVTSPCLVGLVHPTVLLPEAGPTDRESDREVLVHELAHLVRHDHLWNLLGRLSLSILFFQPLLWLLLRRIVRTAEEVCDDYVVDLGLDRRDYARRLAEIAQRFQPHTSAAGVGMVSLKSLLGRRIVRILDGSRRLSVRAGLRAAAATVLVGAAGTLLVGLLAVRQNPADAATNPDAATTNKDESARTDFLGDPLPPGAVARIGTVRLRHPETICRVAFTRDGKSLASAGRGGIRLWETAGGKPVHWWPGQYTRGLALSPDGKRLASAADSEIRILDVSTGEEIRRFEAKQISGLAFAPDGSSLLGWGGGFTTNGGKVVSSSAVVRLFDPRTGNVLREFRGHQGIVFSASLSPDGKTLATASRDNTIRFWETQSGRQLQQITISDDVELDQGKWLPSDLRPQLAFRPNRNLLAVSLPDHSIRLRQFPSGKELRKLTGHQDKINSLAFSSDGRLLVSGGRDETVRVWEVETGRQLRQLSGHGSWVECVAFSPDNQTVASGSQDHTVRLWDSSSGKELHPFDAPQHPFRDAAYSPDGKLIATGGISGLCVWDAETGKLLRRADVPDLVNCVAFSPEGARLLSGSWNHGVRLWNVSQTNGKFSLVEVPHQQRYERPIYAVAFSPDGKRFASGGGIWRWDLDSGEQPRMLDTGPRGARGLVFSPDGRLLASTSDGIVQFWDVESGRLVQQLGNFRDPLEVEAIAFSADGRLLITTEGDQLVTIRVWHVATATQIAQFKHDPLPPLDGDGQVHPTWRQDHALAVSPNGRVLAAAESGNRAVLYDVQTGEVLAALDGHRSFVTALAFSADGTRLFSASGEDLTALVWDLDSVLKPASRAANRIQPEQISVAGRVVPVPQPVPLRAADLAPPVRITAGGKPIDVAGHAAPFLGDFNRDGKNDLLVGQNIGGRLRIYGNTGTNARPKFGSFEWFKAGDRIACVPGLCYVAFTPQLVDFDGDGDTDILTGSQPASAIYLFRRNPDGTFAEAEVLENKHGEVEMGRQYGLAGFAYDWDNDGDCDLLLGRSKYGLVLNEGTGRQPVFIDLVPLQIDGEPISWGMVAPRMADWDGDGRDDLVVGREYDVVWYRNTGTKGRPAFQAPKILVSNIRSTWRGYKRPDDQPAGFHAICVADFNDDGQLDLLLGDNSMESVKQPPPTEQQKARDAELSAKISSLNREYYDLKQRPKDETRQQRIQRHRKAIAKWAERAALIEAKRSAQDYQRHGSVWFYERLAPRSHRPAAGGGAKGL